MKCQDLFSLKKNFLLQILLDASRNKTPITTAAHIFFFFFFLYFSELIRLEDLHELSSHIFSEKIKKERMSPTANLLAH